MEYQNKIYKETGKDISERKLELLNMMTEKQRRFRGMRYAEEMAYFAMLWLKYYRKENTTYDRLVRTVMCEEYCYSDEDEKNIIEQSKPILKEKYKIDIVSLDPLILSSHVPFCRIKEY